MIEDVIKNLNDLYETTKDEHISSQTSIQNNAKAVLSEIMDCVGHHYDLSGIMIKTCDWSRKKGINIENTDNGYYGFNATFTQNNDNKDWVNVDFSNRISGDVNTKQTIKSVEFGQLALAIASKMITNQELMNGLFDKMHKCFSNNNLLEAKMTLINHLKEKSSRTLDLIKVEEVFDKGHLKLDNNYGKWVQTFGTNEKYCNEFKFIKNKTGTYTAELLSDGTVVSSSTRASHQNIVKIVCQMLDITNFGDF